MVKHNAVLWGFYPLKFTRRIIINIIIILHQISMNVKRPPVDLASAGTVLDPSSVFVLLTNSWTTMALVKVSSLKYNYLAVRFKENRQKGKGSLTHWQGCINDMLTSAALMLNANFLGVHRAQVIVLKAGIPIYAPGMHSFIMMPNVQSALMCEWKVQYL